MLLMYTSKEENAHQVFLLLSFYTYILLDAVLRYFFFYLEHWKLAGFYHYWLHYATSCSDLVSHKKKKKRRRNNRTQGRAGCSEAQVTKALLEKLTFSR